jgi:hypothetical protein
MNGLLGRKVVVENTANPGQLQSITDTVAYHKCGSWYKDEVTGDVYVYGRNALASGAVTVGAPYALAPYYSATSGVDWNMGARSVTDLGVTACYIGVPQVAIPNLYYGWFKIGGDITSLTGCANETRAVGDNLIVHNGTFAVQAVSTQVWGIGSNAFAIVTTAQGSGSTTCTSCRLLAREITATT